MMKLQKVSKSSFGEKIVNMQSNYSKNLIGGSLACEMGFVDVSGLYVELERGFILSVNVQFWLVIFGALYDKKQCQFKDKSYSENRS